MRRATAEVISVVQQVLKDVASEEMKRLSTIVKEVVARRREVLNEVSHDIPVLAGFSTYKAPDCGVGKGRGEGYSESYEASTFPCASKTHLPDDNFIQIRIPHRSTSPPSSKCFHGSSYAPQPLAILKD